MRRLIASLALAAALALATDSAIAASTSRVLVPARVWTDLGQGPLLVQPTDLSMPIRFAVSDSQPVGAVGFGLQQLPPLNTTSHVWAFAPVATQVDVASLGIVGSTGSNGGSSSGTSSSPTVVAPTIGTVTAMSLGTSPNLNFIAPAAAGVTTRSLVITNQAPLTAPAAYVTVCLTGVANPITPATNVAGCWTFGPLGRFEAPASAYGNQGFSAVASINATAVTVDSRQ